MGPSIDSSQPYHIICSSSIIDQKWKINIILFSVFPGLIVIYFDWLTLLNVGTCITSLNTFYHSFEMSFLVQFVVVVFLCESQVLPTSGTSNLQTSRRLLLFDYGNSQQLRSESCLECPCLVIVISRSSTLTRTSSPVISDYAWSCEVRRQPFRYKAPATASSPSAASKLKSR